jgi:hypothetical protein
MARARPHKNKKNRCKAGDTFGKLTLVKRVNKPKGVYGDIWLLKCVCGTQLKRPEQYLFRKPNPLRHCGCENKGLPTLYPSEYTCWAAMHGRCYRTDHVSYHHYGGRGIKVCDRWHYSHTHGFANFLADMGPRPKGTQIDRFPDVDGNYEPGNCRWATPLQQASNKRTHKHNPTPPVPDISDIVEPSE